MLIVLIAPGVLCGAVSMSCGMSLRKPFVSRTVYVEDRLCRGPFMSRTVCVYVFRSSISNESFSTIEVLREFHHLRILRNSGDTIPGWYVTGLLGTTLHTCCLQLAEATCAREQIMPMPPRFSGRTTSVVSSSQDCTVYGPFECPIADRCRACDRRSAGMACF